MPAIRPTRVAVALIAAATVLASCGGSSSHSSAPSGGGSASKTLTGLLKITAGTCSATGISGGSYFRMIQPNGTVANGPFVANGDSPCTVKTFSPLKPGTAGGLKIGSYQPMPSPAFSSNGSGLADAIVAPTKFFAVGFAIATPATDPATHAALPPPTLHVAGGTVTGTIEDWTAAYNNAFYNQGAPKPGGATPGDTSAGVTGSYDPATGAMTLTWSSEIVGGAFNGFSGLWHLQGTFVPGG